jgi:hypothetical protein
MENGWPELSYDQGKSTYETLHLWTQIIGKIKMTSLPWVNHSWHVTLYITPVGLTTQTLPYKDRNFQIDLDFLNHQLKVITSKGEQRQFDLQGISVADFYLNLMAILKDLNIYISIRTIPSELENPIPFELDFKHATYDEQQVRALHQAMLRIQDVMMQFRSEFKGKCSPIHLFWGSFDIAVSLFSGCAAPKHPGGITGLPDWVAEEAYCQEVSSFGFWPGNDMLPEPVFYSYIYPEPEGYKTANIRPDEAYYHQTLREFILPYKAIQTAESPKYKLLEFFHSSFRSGVILAKWNRDCL